MNQEPVRIRLELRLERPTREPRSICSQLEEEMLTSAARALEEAIANGVTITPPAQLMGPRELRQLALELAASVWAADELSGESPIEPLHIEAGGWGPPIEAAVELPRQILAADVLDFLASALGAGDRLRWSAKSPVEEEQS